jgi:hypothetical protein
MGMVTNSKWKFSSVRSESKQEKKLLQVYFQLDKEDEQYNQN